MRSHPRLAAGVAAAVLLCTGTLPSTAARAAPPGDCNVKIGSPEQGGQPWEHKRLNVARVWPITDGTGVQVGVIDSGLNTEQAQLSRMKVRAGVNVSGFSVPTDTRDCVYHGTAVAGIIAAPKVTGVYFTGIAPGATIVAIKEQQGDEQDGVNHIAAAILAAVAEHVQVVNISVTTPVDTPDMRAAMAKAAAADIVVVAAGGNDGTSGNSAAYPAAYSRQFPNVLAVSASGIGDAITQFSSRGSYIDIAAPGEGVEVPMPKSGYLANQSGTSFAAPVVAGTAALVRAAHPDLTAAQVVARIEATADAPPGVTVPSSVYGYGIVNPYLAVTALRDDTASAPPATQAAALPQLPHHPPASRHLQHLALGVGTILLGLAVLAGLAAAIVRRVTRPGAALRPAGRPGAGR